MGTHGKKYVSSLKKIDRNKRYTVSEAIKLLKDLKFTKFDESVDVAINLGVNPKSGEQMVRGSCALPNGLGKKVRVLVFAKGEKEQEAKKAEADYVGGDDLVEKIKGGFLDFDKVIATPDMMATVGKLGKILGPKGLMPNPKLGTVTFDVSRQVQELKAGKVEFRIDKAGILHIPVAKTSFDEQKIKENFLAIMEMVLKLKPPTSKGTYLKAVTLNSTMGPGIKINTQEFKK